MPTKRMGMATGVIDGKIYVYYSSSDMVLEGVRDAHPLDRRPVRGTSRFAPLQDRRPEPAGQGVLLHRDHQPRGAGFVAVDIYTDNGIIHIIDEVLMP